ncbi:hypothetical protein QMK52_18905 [Pseudomonas sp. P9_2]|uniref:hypothetical protein n=1 Tax=Pseudomonas sp. P9_2 TaxID=3043447 RepID=UPI002A35ABE7|nr:hypothetical protein [Pseudomonas sp. P9_2]WPN50961.1 hypothetical protein QMK52_18905 [Pseudomonas sp. P9_2]
MSYGLQVVNDSGAISLDSEYARLCVFHKGTYTTGASVVFQNVVDTQEPPLVFIRPPNNGSLIQLGVLLEGSAGAWTGVTVTGGPVHSGNIFVAAFSSKPLATYGLRMWGADGKQLFDSGTQAAVFTRVMQNWTYTHSTQSGQGLITNWYSIPMNYSLGDYLMLNNGRMPMMGGNNESRRIGLQWDFSASLIRVSVTTVSNPYYFRLQAVFCTILS